MKNKGKTFEDNFKESCPDYCLVKRLNDNASSWAGGNNTRFTSTNECDFIVFDDTQAKFNAFELKSTQGSLTYWREDFEDKTKHQTFMIKKNQILGLQKWSKFNNVNSGFVINFREKNNRTFFISICNFLSYTSTLSKKSINIEDVLRMNPIEIENRIKKVNYVYNIDKLLKDLTK